MSQTKSFPTYTPVEFSASLLDSFDKSTESTLTRQERQSQALEKQVSLKLNSLISEKANNLDEKINSHLLSNDSDSTKFLGSPELNTKLDKIYSTLKESAEAKIEKSPEIIAAEKDVTNCLLSNKGRPLNCWEQVQNFKKIAGNP